MIIFHLLYRSFHIDFRYILLIFLIKIEKIRQVSSINRDDYFSFTPDPNCGVFRDRRFVCSCILYKIDVIDHYYLPSLFYNDFRCVETCSGDVDVRIFTYMLHMHEDRQYEDVLNLRNTSSFQGSLLLVEILLHGVSKGSEI